MNEGNGSQARTKESVTANKRYSVFAVKKGNVLNLEPGLCLAFGDTEMMGQFYKLTYFDKLETRDGKAIRLVSYCNQLLGSLLALGRIFDIANVAIIGG